MSSNLMDTEPGGESTQYESIHTVTKPTKKSGGQLGEPETTVDISPTADAEAKKAQGEATAEKIRYGQKISEEGFGGQTTTSSGAADDAGAEKGGDARAAAGYGGSRDQDTEIGG